MYKFSIDIADWKGPALRRRLRSAERFKESAILRGLLWAKTRCSSARALLVSVTRCDQRRARDVRRGDPERFFRSFVPPMTLRQTCNGNAVVRRALCGVLWRQPFHGNALAPRVGPGCPFSGAGGGRSAFAPAVEELRLGESLRRGGRFGGLGR